MHNPFFRSIRLITLSIFLLVVISNKGLAACHTITSVTFSNGTIINNGDVFLITDLPSSVTLVANLTGNPGRLTFDINGAVDSDNFQIWAPYTSNSFTPVAGTYTVIIRVYENLFGSNICEEKEIRFSIKEEPDYTFVENAVDWGINVDNGKDGGLAFGDYDNDGDLDLLVNTDDNVTRSRLYRNNGDYTFTDVTSSLAPHMLTTTRERAAVWGDLNNDGYLDFVRNTSFAGLEIYIQESGGGVFGDGSGGTTPLNFDASLVSDGFNSEGVGMVDFDGDGDIDIIFDNHDHGVDILRNNYISHINGAVVNPAIGSLFSHATPGTTPILGLAQSATDGDYGSFTDVNDDGWVDIFMRKRDENDFFLNQGGTFTNGADLAQANNNNKGAVNLYDYDNDGDFDAFWTEEGDNQIFRNDNNTWVALGAVSGIPTTHSGNSIDEVVSGDVDNDGDIDILLVGDSRSQLYINQLNDPVLGRNTGSPMTFLLNPSYTFHDGFDGEGASMVDIDNDGDLDIYINVENTENELYINNLYDSTTPEVSKNYMFVRVIDDRSEYMQSGRERAALGATVVLEDCDGTVISGIRELNGGTGHGTQDPPAVHFGLVDGPDFSYRVVVRYPNWRNPSTGIVERKEVSKWIRPSEVGTFPINLEFRPSDQDISCPVEICGNGIDDDFDFLTDCEDNDCEGVYDLDGDGLSIYCDIDDDNDGILDVDEGYCSDYVTMIRWTHNENDPDAGDPAGHQKPFYDNAVVQSASNETSGSGISDVNAGTSHIRIDGTNATSLSEAITLGEYLEYRFTTVSQFINNRYHFDATGVYNAMGAYGTTVTYGITLSTDNYSTYKILRSGVEYPAAGNGTYDFAGLNLQDRLPLLESTTYSFRVYFYDLEGGASHSFDDFAVYLCSSDDYDNDGIADFEDVDSDGDECWDAVESGHGESVDDNGFIATTDDEVGENGLDNDLESDDTQTASVNYTIQSTLGQYDFINELINACNVCRTAVTNPHVMYYRSKR